MASGFMKMLGRMLISGEGDEERVKSRIIAGPIPSQEPQVIPGGNKARFMSMRPVDAPAADVIGTSAPRLWHAKVDGIGGL